MIKLAIVLAAMAFSRDARRDIETRIENTLKGTTTATEVSGTVTFVKDDFFFIQNGDDGLKVVIEDAQVPAVGDVVAVNGKAQLEGGRVILGAENYRKIGTAKLPMPRRADSESLIFVSSRKADDVRDINWLRVEVEGRAMGLTENGFSINIDNLPVSVAIEDMPSFLTDCDHTRPLVSVRGVAELFLDQSKLFGRDAYVIGVRICAASADDVTLIPDIGYLVRKRERRVMMALFASLAALLIFLALILVYVLRNRRLRKRTELVMGERKRMADDLHDTIEQHLAGVGMLLKLVRMPQNNLSDAVDRPIREAQDVLLRAKHEMRDIVWGLKNDDMMRLTPAEVLRRLAETETRKGVFRIRTRIKGLPDRMPLASVRDLSLIVREAIGNAVKHGCAGKIAIVCDPLADGGWMLRVANDGEPFDRALVPGSAEGHFGLEGMNERALRIGVKLSFARKGKWTIVELRGK